MQIKRIHPGVYTIMGYRVVRMTDNVERHGYRYVMRRGKKRRIPHTRTVRIPIWRVMREGIRKPVYRAMTLQECAKAIAGIALVQR